jgi:hypothetical protein
MFDHFYYVHIEETSVWQLRDAHFSFICLATASTLDDIMQRTTDFVKRYKTDFALEHRLNNLEYDARSKGIEYDRQKTIYKEIGNKYEDYVREAVLDGLTAARESSLFNKVQKSFKRVALQNTVQTPSPAMGTRPLVAKGLQTKETAKKTVVMSKPLVRTVKRLAIPMA